MLEKELSPYDQKIWIKSYDAHVRPKLDYPKESLGKLFDDAVAKYPHIPACYFMEKKISFKEIREMVHRFATFLQKNGLQKGDRVAINLPNCPQYLVAHFGTLLAGGVASGCSPLMSPNELEYQINDSGAKFFVTLDAIFDRALIKILDKVPNLRYIITTNIADYMGFPKFKVILGKLLKKIPKGKVAPYPGKNVLNFKDVMETLIDLKQVSIDVDNDLALLQYTGGTTGLPKGTELTHANITANLIQIKNWLDFKEEDEGKVNLSAFPLFHLAGLQMSMVTLFMSCSQVLIANPRDTTHVIKEMIDKKPRIVVNVPTLYLNIKNSLKTKEIPESSLKNIEIYVSGAAPFLAEAIRDFEKAMKAENKLLEVYGMTETSPIITMNPYRGMKKVGTVGLPLQDLDLRLDEDGYLKIVDRTKDMLIVSGYKVYSVHVEDVLTKHPDIELVAIIGLPDPDRPGSEIVKAVVKLRESLQETETVKKNLKKYASEYLSKYENPKIWEFREELPLTIVGKVLKRALRDEEKK
jgi:long-chain acyl-CoA synthetase